MKTCSYKLIHQFTGTTYTDIIYECRLEIAKELPRFTAYKFFLICIFALYKSYTCLSYFCMLYYLVAKKRNENAQAKTNPQ